jgi:organic radical activating enzyme
VSTNITKIIWNLNNYCSAKCSYCPSKFWKGDKDKNIELYIDKALFFITHFNNLGYTIDWTFDGGEPLEIEGLSRLLKTCKKNNGKITLNTNGGYQWLDWWAIEPNVDYLNLTYHYWQNRSLIKFIIQCFQKNNKIINVVKPIRPNFFELDFEEANELEKEINIKVYKTELYNEASDVQGLYPYSKIQLQMLKGQILVDRANHLENTTFAERIQEQINSNPSFTGKACNTGIERLYISSSGWISGSNCNNTHIGNIWDEIDLPKSASICKMQACVNSDDQQITKFL